TSLQTPWFTAYGVIGEDQLGRLSAYLADPELRAMTRVVAIHHPPAGPPAKSRVRGLRDRHRLAEVLAEHGADLVLHGHEHRDLYFHLPGPAGDIPVRGIQSGTYEAGREDKRARYRIYEVGDSGVTGDELRVWDPEAGEFTRDQGPAARAAS
ncbi:MAG: metallophosphoesterase, partial [Deltaproteobacteria bacterium]|nr:metallophosphoesterase [Deltaproteobacteria bacterium]